MAFMEGIPTVVVTLDRPRTLGFTMGAMRRVQERLGTLEVGQDKSGGLLALPVYVWACLEADGRLELSVEQIEDMIHPGNMRAITDAVTALLGASNPEGTEEATDQTQDPPRRGRRLAATG